MGRQKPTRTIYTPHTQIPTLVSPRDRLPTPNKPMVHISYTHTHCGHCELSPSYIQHIGPNRIESNRSADYKHTHTHTLRTYLHHRTKKNHVQHTIPTTISAAVFDMLLIS